jgi:Protein of unknown function (DUF4242)
MGPQIQWIQSFVSDDAVTCFYLAANEELLRQHGSRGRFPVTRIVEIRAVIDPSIAGMARAGR